ncbi:hypothetical protein HD884_002159 [Ochrobactrum intermedium]|nr:hypothetical protein [Ochrobactrum sp. RH1CCR137]MBA8858048.1 hypothetical protein [Ochrobactrum sp. RH1CCR134]NYD82096.1 hypothetical protein [Brucella intermedia]
MGWALRQQEYQSFALHIRCENCMVEAVRGVTVPVCTDMPRDADELLESALLGDMSFRCVHCQGVIGRLLNVTVGEVL